MMRGEAASGAKLLSDDEIKRILLAALYGGPKTEEELKRIVTWAMEVRGDQALLRMVLAGKLSPSWSEGEQEISFTAMP